MTTLETLKAARNSVQHGWCQHMYSNKGKVCMAGAICRTKAPTLAKAAARKLLSEIIDAPIVQFNDTEGRTQAQVLQAFDAAIAKLTTQRGDIDGVC